MTATLRTPGPALAAALALLAGRKTLPPTTAAAVRELRLGSSMLNGFLGRKVLPNSLALLPRPPAPGWAHRAADARIHNAKCALRGSSRWRLTEQDNELKPPGAAGTFACAPDLDTPRTGRATPEPCMNSLALTSLFFAKKTSARRQRRRPGSDAHTGASSCP
jgi:acid phosphatase (class A)